MQSNKHAWILFLLLATVAAFEAAPAQATVFSTVRGIVHDTQHRPVAGASVRLQAHISEYTQDVQTGTDGGFRFDSVPLGNYSITVSNPGFEGVTEIVVVSSGSAPVLHIQLKLAPITQTVTVSAETTPAIPESATPETVVDREQIRETPGADRSNSLAMITNYVPGAYIAHDQLHVRGGHQTSWLVDGVPIPNSNIASNLGPQIDPNDIDTIEVQRGSYAADYGDRTYAVFNVEPRTGFERDNLGELVLSAGNFFQTNDQINFGSHTERFAYYASLSGYRSDLGLETPISKVVHDLTDGVGGFGSFIFNVDSHDQLRLITSARRDFYQIPYDPANASSPGVSFVRDAEIEGDVYVNLSWLHTLPHGILLTVSPFFHFNRANYQGNPNDFPVSTEDNHASDYAGGQATWGIVNGKHNARAGVYGFEQHDNQIFGLTFNDGSNPNFQDRENISGSLTALFAEEQYKATSWLTLNAGVRQTHFSGGVVENNTSPRAGAALRIPKLNWTFRGFYGRFYQAPPLVTAAGPLLQFVTGQNLGFIPLRGERDEEHQFGVTIPWRGWTLDADTFRTRVNNFFDHSSVGESNVFFPLTIDGALVRAWELTLHSPRLGKRVQLYVTYSNQIAQGRGRVTGGLTNFSPPTGYFALDHDQRNTLHVGGNVSLPWQAYASTDVYYGSGFTNGTRPPDYLPGHTTVDLSLGKRFGESISVSLNGLNVGNRRVLLDNSQTFGGTHFLNPREMYVQVRWRFHY
jgi:outer membrane receptor protein involved in Fe transport